MFKVPEKYRFRGKPPHGTTARDGNYGWFFIQPQKKGPVFKVRAAEDPETGWEHVSVPLPDRCPSWSEMCRIKDLFWEEGDAVMQLHPAKSDHINVHPYCLHLWRCAKQSIPLPPHFMV